MKKNAFLPAIISTALAASSCFAVETDQKSMRERIASPQISLMTEDKIEIGLQTYSYSYEEEVDGAFFMSTKGQKYGLSVTASKHIGKQAYLIADLRYAAGDVRYKSASGTGDVSDHMYEGRLLAGIERLTDGVLWSSFIGLGYRYLYNDLRDLGSGGYRRESRYVYVPIGITHRFRLNRTSRISTTLEYDYFVEGEQKSYLSDVSSAHAAVFGDPVNDQNDGYGIRFNTSYEEEHWSVGVFLNYWKIEDSEVNYYADPPLIWSILEPKNETKEAGVQIKYRF